MALFISKFSTHCFSKSISEISMVNRIMSWENHYIPTIVTKANQWSITMRTKMHKLQAWFPLRLIICLILVCSSVISCEGELVFVFLLFPSAYWHTQTCSPHVLHRIKVPSSVEWWRRTGRGRNRGPKCQTLLKDQTRPKSKWVCFTSLLGVLSSRCRFLFVLLPSIPLQVLFCVLLHQALLERTGYTLDVTTGQRKYGGPPPGSTHAGVQPTIGTEVSLTV